MPNLRIRNAQILQEFPLFARFPRNDTISCSQCANSKRLRNAIEIDFDVTWRGDESLAEDGEQQKQQHHNPPTTNSSAGQSGNFRKTCVTHFQSNIRCEFKDLSGNERRSPSRELQVLRKQTTPKGMGLIFCFFLLLFFDYTFAFCI